MISNGVSFNPAVEKEDYNRQNNNHRIYQTCDPLYKIMGQYITNGNIEVRNKDGGFGECHSVDTFSGGARNMDSFLDDEDSRTKTTGGAMPPSVAMGSQRFGMMRPMGSGVSGGFGFRDILGAITNHGIKTFANEAIGNAQKRGWYGSDEFKEKFPHLVGKQGYRPEDYN
jgi:hypothetical protein